mmetsp:Transcript_67141/g.212542  ORF Transcript_67141/g.212542 Transcript_67141/m.212542 type:complete len:248 (-) Transcript_67141:1900-2643(-)
MFVEGGLESLDVYTVPPVHFLHSWLRNLRQLDPLPYHNRDLERWVGHESRVSPEDDARDLEACDPHAKPLQPVESIEAQLIPEAIDRVEGVAVLECVLDKALPLLDEHAVLPPLEQSSLVEPPGEDGEVGALPHAPRDRPLAGALAGKPREHVRYDREAEEDVRCEPRHICLPHYLHAPRHGPPHAQYTVRVEGKQLARARLHLVLRSLAVKHHALRPAGAEARGERRRGFLSPPASTRGGRGDGGS